MERMLQAHVPARLSCSNCVRVQVAELMLTGWPTESAPLLQDCLLRLLALVLTGGESSFVVASASRTLPTFQLMAVSSLHTSDMP